MVFEVEVAATGPLTVRLECEGPHEGMWRGVVCPTDASATSKSAWRLTRFSPLDTQTACGRYGRNAKDATPRLKAEVVDVSSKRLPSRGVGGAQGTHRWRHATNFSGDLPSGSAGLRQLPRCVRWHVGAFPRVSASPEAHGTPRFARSLTERATSSAHGDVAEVANRLATAFPQLVRRVTSVAVDGPITVRLECVGLHEGMWGDTICPTKRRVAFEEQHEIIAVDGRVVSDQIMLDVRGILLQLCGGSRIDPDETVRMGKARDRHATDGKLFRSHFAKIPPECRCSERGLEPPSTPTPANFLARVWRTVLASLRAPDDATV